MKTKRVGTVSMALVLIMFGVILLLSQFMLVSAFELFVKLWPFIIIVLGIEILYTLYRNGEEVNLKYDVFSIFIVILILLVNIGIYGLMETGLMDLIKVQVQSEIHQYQNY